MLVKVRSFLPERIFAVRRTAIGRTSTPRRRVAVYSTATCRWSRRGREVLLGKQDLPKSPTAPVFTADGSAVCETDICSCTIRASSHLPP
jgi:hypothetical protein